MAPVERNGLSLRRVIQIWMYLASVARTLTADFVPSLISCRAPAAICRYLSISSFLYDLELDNLANSFPEGPGALRRVDLEQNTAKHNERRIESYTDQGLVGN